jgi:hypothetical protein
MIYKSLSPLPEHVRVNFALPGCLWADQIFVVGDFNGWTLCATPMRQERNGSWCAVVDLPSGCRSAFRYFIDGRWLTDRQADGWTSTADGTGNSLVVACLSEADGGCEGEQHPGWAEPTSVVPLPAESRRTALSEEIRRQQIVRKALTSTLWQMLQQKREGQWRAAERRR